MKSRGANRKERILNKTMKYPSNQEFKAFLKRLPKWILWLILVMLFGRFIILGYGNCSSNID